MYFSRLSLIDFRSWSDVEVSFTPGVTTILGSNGQGKTNLIEALGFACFGKSHRVPTDAPLVRAGAERAVVRVAAQRDGREIFVELEINPGRSNRARLNRAPVTRPREALGHLRRVLFCPEDLSLVKGDPRERRAFLDDLLTARVPRFSGVLSDLDRVLRQRNSLLKSASGMRGGGAKSRGIAEQTLTVWDDQFVALAAEVIEARDRLVSDLRPLTVMRYSDVAPNDTSPAVEVKYLPGVPDLMTCDRSSAEVGMRISLAKRRDEEFARGVTLSGPHRDEVDLRLRGLPIRGFASHGECWSMALALRLSTFDLMSRDGNVGSDPVLILDDVFAELDSDRRGRLAELVSEVEQVIVTAAVAQDVPKVLQGECLHVSDGRARSGVPHE